MFLRRATRDSERGQVLAIVAGGMIVIVAMVGLVIDGGNAWGRQRETQNAADSVAKAGTVVIQQYLAGGTEDGADVACAVEEAADENRVELESAEYTNHEGTPLGAMVPACGGGGGIPGGAQGIKAIATQDFSTYLMGVVGFSQLTARADATAVVGKPAGVCPAGSGCGVLPVTVPYTTVTCDGQNRQVIGEGEWAVLDEANGDVLTAANEVLIPLCATGPGSVGWLDFGCAPNLSSMIKNPCNVYIPIPAWLRTQTGNVNALENDLEQFTGPTVGVAEEADAVMYIPIHDNTCSWQPAHDDDTCESIAAEGSGTGSNLYYHVPYWQGFKMDGVYTGGNDAECNQPPGNPAFGNGATVCLKGWFVSRVTSPGAINTWPISPGEAVAMRVGLVR